MKDIDGIANVKSDLTQTYDQYEIKVDQNAAIMASLQVN